MRKIVYSTAKEMFSLLMIAIMAISSKAQTEVSDSLPFLKSKYLYEYLHESKTMMNGNVVSETTMETEYDDDNKIVSMITKTNGQKSMESVDYKYGDKTRSYTVNMYMNGNLTQSTNYNDTFADDIYRNMLVSEMKNDIGDDNGIRRFEWTYDDKGRIIGMKHFLNGVLQSEQREYVWTPNSCEYVEETFLPFPSMQHVSKQFKDDNYVQNILEIHKMDMNGMQSESRNEYQYDDDGNIISSKSYSNGELFTEWKDYSWGDKKSTHTEIMYMNGTPMSTTEVTQYFK